MIYESWAIQRRQKGRMIMAEINYITRKTKWDRQGKELTRQLENQKATTRKTQKRHLSWYGCMMKMVCKVLYVNIIEAERMRTKEELVEEDKGTGVNHHFDFITQKFQ